MKNDIKLILAKTAKIIDSVVLKILCSSVYRKHHKIIKHQIEIGGKRLRPVLAILSCRMMGGATKDALYPAAALEILHNYTLIVDDIIDHSDFRRGQPTVCKKYGRSIAESISISYAASIFDIADKRGNVQKCYPVFAKTLKMMADGEIFDILFEQGGRDDEKYIVKNRYRQISLNDYFGMIGKKTAGLTGACAEVGGVCANASAKEIKLLKSFGYNLGMAFQIQDDILDIFGDEKKFGKKIGKDIEERKLGNITILLAMDEFSLKDKKRFLNILRKKKISGKDIKEGIGLIKKTSAQSDAYKLEMNYIKKAKQSLANLPKNKWNDILNELTDYLVERRV